MSTVQSEIVPHRVARIPFPWIWVDGYRHQYKAVWSPRRQAFILKWSSLSCQCAVVVRPKELTVALPDAWTSTFLSMAGLENCWSLQMTDYTLELYDAWGNSGSDVAWHTTKSYQPSSFVIYPPCDKRRVWPWLYWSQKEFAESAGVFRRPALNFLEGTI